VIPSVLFLNRVFPPDRGATGRVLADLAGRFAAAGWRTTVLACGDPGGDTDAAGIRIVRAGAGDGRGPGAAGRQLAALAAAALRLPCPDLAVTMTDPPFLALLGPLLRRRGAATVHWCQDLYPDVLPALGVRLPGPALAALARAARRAVADHDAVVAIGACMAARLMAAGQDRRPVLTIPNWPDPAIAPAPQTSAAVRAALGLGGQFVAMYAGNAGRAHRFDGLLDAAARLRDRRPDITVVVAGDGARSAEVAAAASRRGLGNVRFLPRQPAARLPATLGAADVHLATMAEEALGCLVPCKVYGALAAGRPCLLLGPAGGEAARLLETGGAGAVLPPDDGAGLAAWLERLADRPDLRAAMAAAARPAVAPYRLEHAAATFLSLAERLVAVPGVRPAETPAAGRGRLALPQGADRG
jgi:glycosyltransferase involved in cell wall biosynthesis